MAPEPEENSATDLAIEKRGSRRQPTTARVTVRLGPTEISAVGRDISRCGLYALTGDDLRVTITIKDGAREIQTTGRIVRVETPAKETTGIAIAFDKELA